MPPRLGRRSLLLAALGGVIGALSGCGGGGRGADGTLALSGGTVPIDGPRIELGSGGSRLVAMVGDSITVGSAAGLRAAAARLGVDLVIDAEVGRRITVGSRPAPGIDAVTELAHSEEPDLWVIALGTNDVAHYATSEEYTAQIAELLELIPPEAPIAWINVYLAGQLERSAMFNRALTDVLSERGRASVGSWTAVADDDGVLSDGVHPSDEGVERFVEVVTTQIDSWVS